MSRLCVVILLIKLICRVHHEQHWAGWSTSWNQFARRNINTLRYADDTTLMSESEEELKSLLMKVKEESENVGLKPIPWGRGVSVENTKCCIPCGQNQRQLPTKTLRIISSQSWLSCRLTSKIPRNFAIIPVSLWFSVQQWDLSKIPTLMILHKYFWSLWWKSYKSK